MGQHNTTNKIYCVSIDTQCIFRGVLIFLKRFNLGLHELLFYVSHYHCYHHDVTLERGMIFGEQGDVKEKFS